jgi:hypothetical protein
MISFFMKALDNDLAKPPQIGKGNQVVTFGALETFMRITFECPWRSHGLIEVFLRGRLEDRLRLTFARATKRESKEYALG